MINYLCFILSTVWYVLGAPIGSCPGGYQNGEIVERGRYWYQCQNGELVPKGCLSEKKRRLISGETFHKGGFVIACVTDENGVFEFAYKGCMSYDGHDHMPGDTWQDANYWYKCNLEDSIMIRTVEGCVDNGKRYKIGESVVKGDLIYECHHFENGNTGFDIHPNDKAFGYFPEDDRIHVIQTVPPPVDT